MKIVKKIFVLAMISLPFFSFSQEKKKTDTIIIQTSAQCEMCKERIEKALAYTSGVKKSNLDLETKKITVIYNPKKTSPEKIREAISKAGYDADALPADENAYQNLPDCCKKDGHQ